MTGATGKAVIVPIPIPIPIRILIVEDVEEMREFLAEMLGRADGIQVSGRAANCWEARLEVTRRRPDLVLLDEILPGESSTDLLRELHADGIPVLLMTGMDEAMHAVPPEARGRIRKPDWKSGPQGEAILAAQVRAAIQG